jgi:hypothetical protein
MELYKELCMLFCNMLPFIHFGMILVADFFVGMCVWLVIFFISTFFIQFHYVSSIYL